MNTSPSERGQANPLLISNIITALIVVALTGLSIWLYGQYTQYKDNANSLVSSAVSKARAAQQKEDEEKALEREKLPTRTYQGPADLGGVSFQYPKTWSVYVAKNTNELETYLQPDVVPPVASTQPYATRVLVEDRPYETIVKSYDSLIKKGELRSNPVTIEGFSGVRLDGKFSKDREGSAVLFKVRDKTLTIASDSTSFKSDFDNTVLKSLKFNP